MRQLSRDLEDGIVTTIPLTDDFPHHAGCDSTPDDGIEFGITCCERLMGIRQKRLEWTRRLSVFPADDGDNLVCVVRGYFARTRYVAGSGEKDVKYVFETTWIMNVDLRESISKNMTRPTFCEHRLLRCGQSGHKLDRLSAMRPSLVRALSTRASAVYSNPANAHDPAITSTPLGLTYRQRASLDSALRVDHAGEIAANYIYKGQMAVLGRNPTVGPLIQVCYASSLAFFLVDRPLHRKCGTKKSDISLSWTNFKYNIRCGLQYSLT